MSDEMRRAREHSNRLGAGPPDPCAELKAAARVVVDHPATRAKVQAPGAEWMAEIPVPLIDALRAAVDQSRG